VLIGRRGGLAHPDNAHPAWPCAALSFAHTSSAHWLSWPCVTSGFKACGRGEPNMIDRHRGSTAVQVALVARGIPHAVVLRRGAPTTTVRPPRASGAACSICWLPTTRARGRSGRAQGGVRQQNCVVEAGRVVFVCAFKWVASLINRSLERGHRTCSPLFRSRWRACRCASRAVLCVSAWRARLAPRCFKSAHMAGL
jgi:hypothetical protein